MKHDDTVTTVDLLDLYSDLGAARRMMIELKAPASMISRVTDARLAISWLIDHR